MPQPDLGTLSEGLIVWQSPVDPKRTTDRLIDVLEAHGFKITARIDHAADAAQVGLELPPTELVLFANPLQGTPLMEAMRALAIDLPLKALVWQDDTATTLLAYNDPVWLARRHHLGAETDDKIAAMSAGLARIAAAAGCQEIAENGGLP